jgi:hypothetical protein
LMVVVRLRVPIKLAASGYQLTREVHIGMQFYMM